MASNQTENYGLNQWEVEDQVQRIDFNADNAKIDAALSALAEQAAEKADSSALTALTATINGKAAQSAVDSLTQQETADVAALRGENCWVKLKEITTGTVNSVSISTADINWNQYRLVVLTAQVQGNAVGATLYMRFNNLSSTSYYCGSNTAQSSIPLCYGAGSGGFAQAVLGGIKPTGSLMGHLTYVSIPYAGLNDRTGFAMKDLTLEQVTSIQVFFDDSTVFTAGSEITIYGLKM